MDPVKHIDKFIGDMPERTKAICMYCHKEVETNVDNPEGDNLTVCPECERNVPSDYFNIRKVEKWKKLLVQKEYQ